MNNPLREQPLVSVVINCYNSEEFLGQAIESIFNQTYQNWEIIFWDNASSDSSAAIAQSFGDRVRYYFSPVLTNLGKARNGALKMAKGTLVGFLDCDDLWHPQKLEQQVNLFLENPNLGFVYSKAAVIDSKNKILDEIPPLQILPSGVIFDQMCKKNLVPFPSALCSLQKLREIGGVPTSLKTSTDYAIFLSLSQKYEVASLQYPTCSYRVHEKMNSHSFRVQSIVENISIVEKFLPSRAAYDGLKYHFITLIFESFREKNITELRLVLFRKYFDFSIFFMRVIKGVLGKGNSIYRK
jgi:glycosyltransferase involved in cell wall biosynthesis